MSWRDTVKDAATSDTLAVIAGKWSITFLDNGEPYSFTGRNEKEVHGVRFLVNGKHHDSGGTFPKKQWGLTAVTILRRLADIEDLEGWTIKFLALGQGIQRKYEQIELIAPTEQAKLKGKKAQ